MDFMMNFILAKPSKKDMGFRRLSIEKDMEKLQSKSGQEMESQGMQNRPEGRCPGLRPRFAEQIRTGAVNIQ